MTISEFLGSYWNFDLARGGKVARFSAEKPIRAEINGTLGNDVLDGTADADTINGGDGNDTINGLGGNDTIRDGAGDDTVNAGGGADIVYVGTGNDTVYGGDGDDQILRDDPSSGVNYLYGEGGDDFILVNAFGGNQYVYGGIGNDVLVLGFSSIGTKNTYHAWGGAGHDSVYVQTGGDINRGGDGRIVFDAGTVLSQIDLGSGNDVIRVRSGYNALTLGAGADRVEIENAVGFVLIQDYEVGLDSITYIDITSAHWDGNTNPFATGLFVLEQDGADTLLRLDYFGNGSSMFELIRFVGIDASTLTAADLGGWNPDGSAPTGLTLTGTENADLLVTNDVGMIIGGLAGSNGADSILGLGGDDEIFGYAGNDTIDGGAGNDGIDAGAGDDVVTDLEGNNFIIGGRGNDSITTGGGSDEIRDYNGVNTIRSGGGDDLIDIVLRDPGHSTINAGAGNDRLFINLSVPQYVQTPGTVTANMGSGADHVVYGYGSGLAVTVPVEISLILGDGNDTVAAHAIEQHATITLGNGADAFWISSLSYAPWLPVEETTRLVATITDFDPTLDYFHLFDFTWGYSLTNWTADANLFASGHFRIVQSGNDAVLQIDRDGGGDGFISIVVLQNVDAATLTAANFQVTLSNYTTGTMAPNSNIPVIAVATEGDDVLKGTSDADTIDGLGGNDRILGGGGSDLLVGSDGNDRLYGETGYDDLRGGAGNDRLDGGSGNDKLDGGDGDDRLIGRDGNDRMIGGTGGDIYFVDDAGDTVIELAGEGTDRVVAGIDYVLGDNLEVLRMRTGDLDGTGNALDNLLRGVGGANVLDGMAGNDDIYGGTGNDTLVGGAGDDRLYGEVGTDSMTGGTGLDFFIFQNAGELGDRVAIADRITDFSQSDGDRMNVRGIDANTNTGGDQNFAFIGNAAFSGTAGQLRYFQTSTSTVVEMDVDGDGTGDLYIRLDGQIDLTAGDFVL